ncbi:GNAT family N-acetyltransferase (plasmid) [Deinococcus sp. KNUC1210]|uniref:GNAT family N-acetyltransferase n=1 Tax=Deinococcus sp. KNUC1210 TaxID=2917691 RepID=UPI001EEFEFCC|nr:GNAT family N-acetyltransferase [Deinococcus sp. KNUC1210]ULH18147.1 GNAT family N-acetyltransferase [Deinococcus sp. KNUC1210]
MPTLEMLTPSTASDLHLRALAHHLELIRAERMPSDPPFDAEAIVAGLRKPDPTKDRHYLLLWEEGQVVARATVTLSQEHHLHQAEVELSVLVAHRQRGLARLLLREIARLTEQSGRQLLLTNASSRLPSGEAVLRHLGAQLVMEQQFMELDLHGLDPQMLVEWVREAARGAPEYLTWSHLGPYPQKRLPAIAQVYDVMQTAPQGTRDTAAGSMTPEALQRQDEQLLTAGRQRLTTFAEHRPTGSVVAFTELFWDVKRPTIMIQHGTAVQPEHRLHSLGRWIKAANLLTAQRLSPEVRFVRAGNTDDNIGMLRINQALGFRPYLTHTDWQLEVNDLRAYLDRQHA